MKELSLAVKVGQAMRDVRKAMELSQDDFADHIDMHRAYYGAIERGEKNITMQTLHRIASGLGTTMSALLDGVDE